MSQISSMFGHLPGMGDLATTFEQAIAWGPYPRYYQGAYIGSTAVDSGNTPTTTLRMGLVMGRITSTGAYVNYSPTATDGSEVAAAILTESIRLADVITGTATARFYSLMVSGGVQGSKLLGLDGMARAQLADRFYFDDDLAGAHWFPWKRFVTKTADYTVLGTTAENFTQFNTLGAGGAVIFTLPTIACGLAYSFANWADQNMTVASAEGDNMILMNDLSADSAAFSTGGEKIGGVLNVYSNAAGTKWIVENVSAGANTVTVAT